MAISNDGGVVVGGAPLFDAGGDTDCGIVRVSDWNGSGYTVRGSVISPNRSIVGLFGTGVSLTGDGNTLVVGAPGENTNRGRVYTFDWNGSSWVQRGSQLEIAGGNAGDNFGFGVALSDNGNVLVVSAPGAPPSGTGALYTYDRSGSNWIQRGSVFPGPVAGTVSFGNDLSLNQDGTRLVVGSPSEDNNGFNNNGGVYIYNQSGTTWSLHQPVIVNGDDSDRYGAGVGISGDGSIIVIGAPSSILNGTNVGTTVTYTIGGVAP